MRKSCKAALHVSCNYESMLMFVARAYEEKRACNSQCIPCIYVVLLISQQDMLYLAMS